MEQVRPEAAPRAPGPAPGPAADENPVVLRKADEIWCMQSHRLHALCTWPSRCYVAPHVRDRRLRWLRAGSLSGWESADVRLMMDGCYRPCSGVPTKEHFVRNGEAVPRWHLLAPAFFLSLTTDLR